MTFLLVALGGALGATLRYLTVQLVAAPLGTLVVNVLGSLAMGLAFALLATRAPGPGQLMLMTGVLGGFTTFSAFSLDAFRLYEAGQMGAAAAYVFGSVVLSLLALVVGVALARGIAQ